MRLEPKMVARVWELSPQGLSVRQIVHKLNVEGYRTSDNRPWSRKQVQRVLKLIPQQ